MNQQILGSSSRISQTYDTWCLLCHLGIILRTMMNLHSTSIRLQDIDAIDCLFNAIIILFHISISNSTCYYTYRAWNFFLIYSTLVFFYSTLSSFTPLNSTQLEVLSKSQMLPDRLISPQAPGMCRRLLFHPKCFQKTFFRLKK